MSLVGLTVSHLPTSSSFFLTALQPLDYRYTGQQGKQITFGIDRPEFFICQKSPGIEPEAVQLSLFGAPSRAAVDAFFSAALSAGGKIYALPAFRTPEASHYSAVVIDLDHNAIEVVHRAGSDTMSTVSSSRGSRVTECQPSLVSRSHVERSPLQTIITKCIVTTTTAPMPPSSGTHEDATASSKAFAGTLLGAAAGATIAYVMMQAEQAVAPIPLPGSTHQSSVTQRYVEPPPTAYSTVTVRRRTSSDSHTTGRGSSVRSPNQVTPRAIESPASAYTLDALSRGLESPSRRALLPARSAHIATASTVRAEHETKPPSGYSRVPRASHQPRSPPRTAPSVHTVRTSTSRTLSAAEVPRPASPPASVRRSATDGPASAAAAPSTVSVSTVRPLTRANVERASTVGADPAPSLESPAAIEELATVVPDDSISQASSKRRSRKHHRRGHSADGSSRRSAAPTKPPGSAATVPTRELKKKSGKRAAW